MINFKMQDEGTETPVTPEEETTPEEEEKEATEETEEGTKEV